MLNVVSGRQQWLPDVCVERVLPERVPRGPRRGAATGDGDGDGDGMNGQTREEGEMVVEGEKVKVVLPALEVGNGEGEQDLIQM